MKKKALRIPRTMRLIPLGIFLSLIPAHGDDEQKAASPFGPCTEYRPCTMLCTLTTQSRPFIAIRTFLSGGRRFYLLVDPLKLTTSIQSADEMKACSTSWIELQRQYVPDPYIKALFDPETAAAPRTAAGIAHMRIQTRGIDLTADLCPSKLGLDRDFFNGLVETIGNRESPVPVAIAVSGAWIKAHPDDFSWLLDLVKSNSVAITWINHSYHHYTDSDSGLSRGFLLRKGTRLDEEILRTEQLLIRYSALPSVFFRFPGLVSSDSLIKQVVSFGLIPVGSDAWLAKDQWPTDGSIVLVHANGNEPAGIRRFFKLLRDEKPNIAKRQWSLFDIKESVVETKKESYGESPELDARDTAGISCSSDSVESGDSVEDLDLCD